MGEGRGGEGRGREGKERAMSPPIIWRKFTPMTAAACAATGSVQGRRKKDGNKFHESCKYPVSVDGHQAVDTDLVSSLS